MKLVLKAQIQGKLNLNLLSKGTNKYFPYDVTCFFHISVSFKAVEDCNNSVLKQYNNWRQN